MGRYNIKVIETKHYNEIYIKNVTDKIPGKTSKNESGRKRRKFNELTMDEKSSSMAAKKKYYKNKRFDMARVIDMNFDHQTKFLTLTFKDTTEFDITNYEDSKLEFDKFMKRLRRWLERNKPSVKLKYIAVHELQEDRGAFHFHMILFSFPFIPAKELKALWQNGFIKINKIPVSVNRNSIGLYISKYFYKSENNVQYQNKYYMSRNLNRPSIKYQLIEGVKLSNFTRMITSQTYEQLKNYNYIRPYYSELTKGTIEHVNVTYIRIKKT